MSTKKPDLEAVIGFKLSPEMMAQIHMTVEECVNDKLEELLRRLVDEELDKRIVKKLEEKEKNVEPETTIELKEIPEEEATRLVQDYVDKHPECLTSEIIFGLQLDPDLVLRILNKLEIDKRIRGEKIESK